MRSTCIQAAVLRCKLTQLDAWNASRRAAAATYEESLSAIDVDLPIEVEGREHVWHLYVIRTRDRDRVRSKLADAGVATGLHYPLPLHLEPVLASLGYREGAFPAAEDWTRRGLSLPMFAGIEATEVRAVAEALARAKPS